ncbi:MAG: putative surface protease of transglutaminase family [Candidatus Methanohalarchaeum thermophilum]|uniref:Surface protease of transglutaminase family n=1 Tax=Methanohalarchaeum thermophilum TaxID=1903181 RepID=A0A1Q6DVY3_METT1|nr:MAG: putative surface protease of transglutaminase family [Candidatus Methanohalarchaeum thermophilum]
MKKIYILLLVFLLLFFLLALVYQQNPQKFHEKPIEQYINQTNEIKEKIALVIQKTINISRNLANNYLNNQMNNQDPCLFETWPYNKTYYEKADSYVETHYKTRSEKSLDSLYQLLKQLQFREYERDVFDCTESSAKLEWILEGADYDAVIAYSESFPAFQSSIGHSWVVIDLGQKIVAIEATELTKDNYRPPGIVVNQRGEYLEYTNIYERYMDWLEEYPASEYQRPSDLSFEEWTNQYLNEEYEPYSNYYYNPQKTYETPYNATLGTEYIPESEWDWWQNN